MVRSWGRMDVEQRSWFVAQVDPASAGGAAGLFRSRVRSGWIPVSGGSIPVRAGNQQATRMSRLLEVFSGCGLWQERLFGCLSYLKQ